jgi:hypothetical protein
MYLTAFRCLANDAKYPPCGHGGGYSGFNLLHVYTWPPRAPELAGRLAGGKAGYTVVR